MNTLLLRQQRLFKATSSITNVTTSRLFNSSNIQSRLTAAARVKIPSSSSSLSSFSTLSSSSSSSSAYSSLLSSSSSQQSHGHQITIRNFSMVPPTTPSSDLLEKSKQEQAASTPEDQQAAQQQMMKPPSVMVDEIAIGIQDSIMLYMKYGLGKQRLNDLCKESKTNRNNIVNKWQRMMEIFLATQIHVLAGLGYKPDQEGLTQYNIQLSQYIQTTTPEIQDKLRIVGRDIWRYTLSSTFYDDLFTSKDDEEEFITSPELGIVEAREIMHKISSKMNDDSIIQLVKSKCDEIENNLTDKNDEQGKVFTIAQKHQAVQDVLVNHVYLGKVDDSVNGKTLVADCGFVDDSGNDGGDDDANIKGYIKLQYKMAEHQNDPLIGQYIGMAMMKLLDTAGLNPNNTPQ